MLKEFINGLIINGKGNGTCRTRFACIVLSLASPLKGKTPAEACGIKVEGDNKWITLIQNASHTEQHQKDNGAQ